MFYSTDPRGMYHKTLYSSNKFNRVIMFVVNGYFVLAWINALAYYSTEFITVVISFVAQALIRTPDLRISGQVLYHCATTFGQKIASIIKL
jgi:hypothetical protein